SGQHHYIEHVVHDWCGCRAVVLQDAEGWPTLLIECNDLSIDHCVVWQLHERLHDLRISGVEVVVVPRSQMNDAMAFERDGSISVQLELVEPLFAGRERIGSKQQHRLDEARRQGSTDRYS